MTSPPFSLANPYQGLAQIDGCAQFDGATLWIEFQTRDSLVGWLKGDVARVPFDIDDLDAVDLKHGPFRSHLHLVLQSQTQASEVPGSRGAEVRLRFGRAHRDEVNAFYEVLAAALVAADLA